VNGDEGLERLHLICEDRLPVGAISGTRPEKMLGEGQETAVTHTFMPCQNEAELLWSHVYTMHARTCFPVSRISLGEVVRGLLRPWGTHVLARPRRCSSLCGCCWPARFPAYQCRQHASCEERALRALRTCPCQRCANCRRAPWRRWWRSGRSGSGDVVGGGRQAQASNHPR